MKYRHLKLILNFVVFCCLLAGSNPCWVFSQDCDPPADSMRQYYIHYLDASSEAEKYNWLNKVAEMAVLVQDCSLAKDSSLVGRAFSYETAALQEMSKSGEIVDRMDDFFSNYVHLADSATLAKLYWRFARALSFRNDPIRSAQKYYEAVPYVSALGPYLQVSFYNGAALIFQHLNRWQEMDRLTEEADRIAQTLDLSQVHNLAVYVKLYTIRFYGSERKADIAGKVDTLQLMKYAEEANRLLKMEGILTHSANLSLDLYLALFYVAALTGRPAELEKYILKIDQLLPEIGSHELAGRFRLNIGNMYHQVGDYAKARPYLDDALTSFLAAGDKQIGVSYELYYELGIQEEHEGNILKALAFYDKAITEVEADRTKLGNSNLSAHAFTSALPAFRGKIRMYLLLHQQDKDNNTYLEGALHTLALARGRRFLEMQSRTNVLATIQDAPVADSLFGLLRTVQTNLAGPEISPTVRQKLKQTEADIFAHPYFVKQSFKLVRDWQSLSEIQQKLDANQVILAYFIDKNSLSNAFVPQSAVFIISDDTVNVVSLDLSYNQLVKQIDIVSPVFSNTDIVPSLNARSFDRLALEALGAALITPVLPFILLPNTALIIVPDAPLYALPFSAIRYASEENNQSKYLIESHEISYGLSLQSFFADHINKATPEINLLMLGKSNNFGNNLTDLSYVHDEISVIENIIPVSEVYQDDAAVESLLYDRGPKAKIIHIASHALSDENSELYSALFLSKDKKGNEDGTVYLHELQGRRFNADLVVLSGCGTGTGALLGGEGMVGLHYGFRAAGVRSSIATLWPVDDQSFPQLMTDFYENVSAGRPVAAALRQAQIEAIREGVDPFYWASPVLFGKVDAIQLKPARFSWIWILAGGFILISTVVFALSRRRRRRLLFV